MISVQFFSDQTQNWNPALQPNRNGGLQTPITVIDRFDEGLDEADIKILTDGHDMQIPLPEWTKCRLDLDGDTRDYFVSAFNSKVVGRGKPIIYEVNISLIELVKVTQRLTMDSLCFSNDVSSSGEITTRTISAVLKRVNNQLFTVRLEDKGGVPFKFFFDDSAPWASLTAPELFFTECTLFEALERVGQVFGGFPYLLYSSSGTYELRYRIFDDPNTTHFNITDYEQIEEHSTIDGQAFVLDSYVKNMLSTGENGENAAVYPAYGNRESWYYRSPVTEDYETEVTNSNAFIELPHPIHKILKLECYGQMQNASGGKGNTQYKDLSKLIVEFDIWKTLLHVTAFSSLANAYKETRLYYKQNGNRIENIKAIENMIKEASDYMHPQCAFMKITYIPMLEARIKTQQRIDVPIKPIGQVVNQSANIVNASAYSTYLQGLVNRSDGNYRKITAVQKRNPDNPQYLLAKKGDWVNGQIVASALHTFTNASIISEYTTSKTFNRRSPFVTVSHELRQWSIPADNKVSDRNIHYAENIEWSIGVSLDVSNGSVSQEWQFTLGDYFLTSEKINMVYIAWKTNSEINSDSDDQSDGYALANCDSTPVGRSVMVTWCATDNASMGTRTYDRWEGAGRIANYASEVQQFVAYPPKAEHLFFRISNEAPTKFNFSNNITHTGEEGETNATFALSYPMSNKEQFNDFKPTIDFYTNIEKDLRERILFNLQLDFVGKYGTIVYDKACFWNKLCCAMSTKLRIFINSPLEYGYWQTKPHGSEVFYSSFLVQENELRLEFDNEITFTNIAIADNNGDIMFAKNDKKEKSLKTLILYFSNRKKEWVKI